MERIRAWIKMFFGFSRTETNALIILLPLMAALLLSEPVYRRWVQRNPPDFLQDQKQLDSMISQLRWAVKDSLPSQTPAARPVAHFKTFDPNTSSQEDLKQLGLSPFIIKRIVRYRLKGGVFYKNEDLLRIYGMDSSWYEEAKSRIHINTKKDEVKGKAVTRNNPIFEITDVNTADSLSFVKVKGIGPVLSKRIRAYRSRLGGFVSMEQLNEVYGLDSSVVNELKKKFFVAESFHPGQLNVNTTDLQDLLKHPYIRRNEAQAIVSYRLQHGNFSSIDDLNKIEILNPEWITKIRPYLSLP